MRVKPITSLAQNSTISFGVYKENTPNRKKSLTKNLKKFTIKLRLVRPNKKIIKNLFKSNECNSK